MQEAYINIDNLPTKVVTFGRWITDKPEKEAEKIILIIPGNPGITGFYKVFMKCLYQKHKCPVWAISYASHENDFKNGEIPVSKLLGLEEQVHHKVSFIEQYVPKNANLHVIGHSIGSYITLQLLKRASIEQCISQTYLLFPTIEHMIETSNGRFLCRYIRPILPIIIFLAFIFTVLPKFISLRLLKIYMLVTGTPSKDMDVIFSLIHPHILKQVFFLAFEELEKVRERDDENIKNNLKKICILYGETDGWCKHEFYNSIVKQYPLMRVKMSNYQHAFIFKENEEVAEQINLWMK